MSVECSVLTDEVERLRHEMELAAERANRERETLQQKLTTMEKEYQTSLQQARLEHEQDVTQLTDSKAGCRDFLDQA